jgi:ArsR family metal-binding transcriptional regulator
MRIAADKMLDRQIEIIQVLPCIADAAKIRFHAEPCADLQEVLPYLNAVLPGAIYNHDAPALTFTKEDRIVSVFPRRITGAKASDVEDARAVLAWLTDLINDTWARRAEIRPCYERRERLSPLAIYKLLPGTNCGRCGVPTCLAFAVRLTGQEAPAGHCLPLLEGQHPQKRDLLVELLSAAGYRVPEDWLLVERSGM